MVYEAPVEVVSVDEDPPRKASTVVAEKRAWKGRWEIDEKGGEAGSFCCL